MSLLLWKPLGWLYFSSLQFSLIGEFTAILRTSLWRIMVIIWPKGCSMGCFSLWLWGYVRDLSMGHLPRICPYGYKRFVYFLLCHSWSWLLEFSSLCSAPKSEIRSSKGVRLPIAKGINKGNHPTTNWKSKIQASSILRNLVFITHWEFMTYFHIPSCRYSLAIPHRGGVGG